MGNRQRTTLAGPVAKAKRTEDKARQNQESMFNTVDSFANFAYKMGVGADNPLSSATYGFNPITRNRTLLEWIYRGSWIGGLAVDIVADDMTREGVDIMSTMPPEDLETLQEEVTKLRIWKAINSLVKWDRLYGGCLGVLLIEGQDPETPLRMQSVRKGQFKGILVLDRWQVEPILSKLITDLGPDMGLPAYYRVTANAPAMILQTIHHSRIIRMTGMELPYQQRLVENMWGLSVLERLYDRLIGFDSASTGAAQLVYKSFIRTYKIENFRDIVAAGGKPLEGVVAYVDMMRRFQGVEGITLLDKEDEFEQMSHSAMTGIADTLIHLGQQVSGALQIPLVRLFGQSPAGLNSTGESDMRTYYDGIRKDQNNDLLGPMTKVYKLIALSNGIEIPKGFGIKFKSLWQLTDEQKANVTNSTTQSILAADDAGVIPRRVTLKELRQMSEVTGVFSNITDGDIADAENEAPPGWPEAPEDGGAETPPAVPSSKEEGGVNGQQLQNRPGEAA